VLASRYAVSRITLRQAVDELVRKQLVIRKQGKGTFVTVTVVKHDLRRMHGLLGSLFAQSDAAGAKLLRYELAAPPLDVGELLNLRPRHKALALERLYLIAGKPVGFGQCWLLPEVAALPRMKAELMSTEDMMHEAGIRVVSSQVAIRAEAAGARIGKVLRLPARAPVLALHRKTLGDDGAVKEADRIWFRSDSYELICSARSSPMQGLFDIRNVGEQV
jgi:GntR family transcriptional regulator